MNISQCKTLSKDQKTQAGLNALWITGREWLRLNDPSATPQWDAAFGAQGGLAPTTIPDPNKLRASFPQAYAFAEGVGLSLDGVPGWFPAADPDTCFVDWIRFACTAGAYAGLDAATRNKAIAQHIEVDPDICAQTDAARDPAYATFRGGQSSGQAPRRSWLWLWVALPVVGAVIIASVAGSGPAPRSR